MNKNSKRSPIQWVPGAVSLGVMRPGRESDHSLSSSSAEVKNGGTIPPLPPSLQAVLLSYLNIMTPLALSFTIYQRCYKILKT
jgi:hypothetical protein